MKQYSPRQEGASVLEFLVVVPVLWILALTAIEFGTVFTRLNTITKPVQNATRYLSDIAVNGNNTDPQKVIAKNLIKYGSVNNTGSPILPDDNNNFVLSDPEYLGDHVRLTVVYNHTPVMGAALNNLLQLMGANPINLSFPLIASSVMRFAQ